jgi:hypothetical protein
LDLDDLNGDKILDLVLCDSWIAVALGNGDGSFGPATSYSIEKDAYGVLHGDVNGDTITDLVVYQEHGVGVLLGHGDGTFAPIADQPFRDRVLVAGGGDAALGDLNGDDRLDLVVSLTPGKLDVLLGNGDGTFACPMIFPGTDQFALGDLNGDHRPDLVVTGWGQDGQFLSVLMNTPL